VYPISTALKIYVFLFYMSSSLKGVHIRELDQADTRKAIQDGLKRMPKELKLKVILRTTPSVLVATDSAENGDIKMVQFK